MRGFKEIKEMRKVCNYIISSKIKKFKKKKQLFYKNKEFIDKNQ